MNIEPLTQIEADAVLALLPDAVRQQLRREDVVLAGGAIRDTVAGLPVKDIDIFCHSAEQAERLALGVSPFVKKTLFAYSVVLDGVAIQYVFFKDFKSPADLISQFDFRACGAGIYYDAAKKAFRGGALDGFHVDCKAKTLHFMSQPKDAGKLTALGRALSLAAKGWTLCPAEAAAIITHYQPTLEIESVKHSFRPAYGGAR